MFKPGDLVVENDYIGLYDAPLMAKGDVAIVIEVFQRPYPNGKGFHSYYKLLFKSKRFWVLENPSLKLFKEKNV